MGDFSSQAVMEHQQSDSGLSRCEQSCSNNNLAALRRALKGTAGALYDACHSTLRMHAQQVCHMKELWSPHSPEGACSALHAALSVSIKGVLICLQPLVLLICILESVPEILVVADEHCQRAGACMGFEGHLWCIKLSLYQCTR